MRLVIEAELNDDDCGFLWIDHSFSRLANNLVSEDPETLSVARHDLKDITRLMEALLRAASDTYRATRCGAVIEYNYCHRKKEHEGNCSKRIID